MQRIRNTLCLLLFVLSQSVFATSGLFFNVSESQVGANIDVILCLNGYGPLSCQIYPVHHEVLQILTTIPNHLYPIAGVKVKTPGFSVDSIDSNCTVIDNGYCIFSVSDSGDPATIIINSDIQPNPGTATITVTGSPLGLNASGMPGTLTITNTSSTTTAFNIMSIFLGTALEGKVQETGNTCHSIAPGASCTLTFTPGGSGVPETTFLIEGENTLPVSAKISIEVLPTTANIIVLNPHLALETGASGSMTIGNTSFSTQANAIAPDLTPFGGNLTVTVNTCSAVPPRQTCTLTFLAGGVAFDETSFNIAGTNTNTVKSFISINPPGMAELAVSNSPLFLNTNGPSGTLTITNISSIPATTILSDFTSTGLDGNVTETGNTCANLPPGNSCTITYTPGPTAVPLTAFTIKGSNTEKIFAEIQITALTIGTSFGGGKIACMTSGGGAANLIAANTDSLPRVTWQPAPLSVTGATSDSNGAVNTSIIVNAIGTSPAFAAGRCFDYTVDSAGNTPCQPGNTCYNDWYLPAANELNCLFQNRVAVGGFTTDEYWTSTEKNKNAAEAISFNNGNTPNRNKSSFMLDIRCVRKFTP